MKRLWYALIGFIILVLVLIILTYDFSGDEEFESIVTNDTSFFEDLIFPEGVPLDENLFDEIIYNSNDCKHDCRKFFSASELDDPLRANSLKHLYAIKIYWNYSMVYQIGENDFCIHTGIDDYYISCYEDGLLVQGYDIGWGRHGYSRSYFLENHTLEVNLSGDCGNYFRFGDKLFCNIIVSGLKYDDDFCNKFIVPKEVEEGAISPSMWVVPNYFHHLSGQILWNKGLCIAQKGEIEGNLDPCHDIDEETARSACEGYIGSQIKVTTV